MIKAELLRLVSTRLWLWSLVAAVLCGGGLVTLFALVGPENVDPPMPALDTPEGVRSILGILTVTALVPAVLGTVAMTSEYRHRTITVTFLFAPRRWRILAAKLVAFSVAGVCYGLTVAVSAGVALAVHGDFVVPLRLAATMAIYMVLGVGVGALLRNQVAALAVVVGYLYFAELALLAIPGVNVVYPYLPGGATAALTDFGYIVDSLAAQTGQAGRELLSAPMGAVVLAGYALVACVLAMAFPLRRDVT